MISNFDDARPPGLSFHNTSKVASKSCKLATLSEGDFFLKADDLWLTTTTTNLCSTILALWKDSKAGAILLMYAAYVVRYTRFRGYVVLINTMNLGSLSQKFRHHFSWPAIRFVRRIWDFIDIDMCMVADLQVFRFWSVKWKKIFTTNQAKTNKRH